MTVLLQVRGLSAGYGGAAIIEDIDLDLAENEISVIIGPNGAGKSTLLKTVFALTRTLSGSIRFQDRDITKLKTDQLVPLGISAVPQSRNVFPSLTVAENLDVGTYAHPPADKVAVRAGILELFPDLRDKLEPTGRRTFRRPAPDGGLGASAHERTCIVAAGRTDCGAFACLP